MKTRCFIFLLGVLLTTVQQLQSRPNVLFISADDLRPQLGCYGHEKMITPNLDRLAANGMVFERAYCQAPTCRASRLSVLTGLRPATTRIVTNGGAHFRSRTPDLVTLPQRFKNAGYHAQSLGKIFHGAFTVRGKWNDPKSWSVPAWWPGPRYYYTEPGIKAAKQVFARSSQGRGKPVEEWENHFVLGPSWEAPEVDDCVLYGGQIADRAIETLREIKDKPFFLALGFLKPHLPFIAPKKYWDMYPADEVVVADNQHAPTGAPKLAMTTWGHPRSYTDIPNKGPMPKDLVAKLTRGYAASTTFVDTQVGRVLDELDRLGLRDNTIIVFWGDHGFHLGENGIWGKATNFEMSLRVPLILSTPTMKAKGGRTEALVELVDLYPTLAELGGLGAPHKLQGHSLVPLLHNPNAKWEEVALSQYPHGKAMGRSMRTDRWRLTQWQQGGKVVAVELYDLKADPAGNLNLANDPQLADTVRRLTDQLDKAWSTNH